MGEIKTTTDTLEDHSKREHFGLLLRSRNQVAVICSGKACSLHVQRKVRQVVSKHKEHFGDRSVLTLWALVIKSFFLQATWLCNCTTRRFCNVCSTKNIQNYGRSRTACFTMIMVLVQTVMLIIQIMPEVSNSPYSTNLPPCF